MTKDELKKWLIKNTINKYGKFIATRMGQGWYNTPEKSPIIQYLDEYSPLEVKNLSIQAKVICVLKDYLEFPKCVCGKPLVWRRTNFSKYCCSDCANKHTAKHGKDAHINNPETKKKIKQAFLKKYGVDNPFKIDTIKAQIKQTNLTKFGGQPMCDKEVKQKYKNTSLKRYGAEHFSKTNKFKKIITEYNQKDIPQHILKKTYDKEWLMEQHYTEKKTLSEIALDLGVSFTLIWERFRQFNIDVKQTFSASANEKEIELFLNSLGFKVDQDFIRNTRAIIPPKELDFYFPNTNIAIEYNGIYYHSTKFLPRTHHKEKTEECFNKNIKLFHIYEDEWLNKQDIWKSILKKHLQPPKPIGARKFGVVLVDNQMAAKFYNSNHLQGAVNCSVNIGLELNGEIYSVMSFSKNRFSNKCEWELVRFASLLNHKITGGASKLFQHFIRGYSPKSVISYADKRYSQGDLYYKLGFKLDHITPPNYSYLIGNHLESRQKWQKKNQAKKLVIFDSNKTEEQNMLDNNYYRVYNCGQMVFVK